MTSRRPWYVAALLTGLGGLCLVLAATVRWFPCVGDAATCRARQVHGYDYLVPVEPWQALPATVVLAGVGLLLVAAAWPLIAQRLRIRPALRVVVLVIMTAKPLLLGLLVLTAPLVGALPPGATTVLLTVQIGLDLAALVVVLTMPSHWIADYQRVLVAAVAYWLVGWVGQVLDALIFGLMAPDAVVPPGSGLLTGVAVMVCGGGIAAITATAQERQLPSAATRNPLERPTDR